MEDKKSIVCPNCKNTVYDDEALLCFYCGESLKRPIGVFGKLREWGFIIAVIMLILFFILFRMSW